MKKNKIVEKENLYKWNKTWKRQQEKFWGGQYKLRRIQNIEDFVYLNNYKKVFHIEEVLLDMDIPTTSDINEADLILVTHQGYSRYSLDQIINQIQEWLSLCPDIYFCLNSQYLNINNKPIETYGQDYLQDITLWLQDNLKCVVVDLSRYYVEDGKWFTWVVPDRQYYIKKHEKMY